MREPKINEQITAERVRLIDLKGRQLGILNLVDALARAQHSNVDLVQVSEESEPPVCKLLDYKKYVFDRKKKRALSKRKHKRTVLKEVKFRPATEEGDYQVKLKNLSRFLGQGDRAKITIRFRGREVIYKDQGYEVLNRIVGDLAGIAEPEQESKLEGKQLMTVLRPIPKQPVHQQPERPNVANKKEIAKGRMDQPRVAGPRMDQQRTKKQKIDRQEKDRPRIDGSRMDQPRVAGQRMDQQGKKKQKVDRQGVVQPRIDGSRMDQPRVAGQRMNQQKMKKQGTDQPRVAGQGMNQQKMKRQGMDQQGKKKQKADRQEMNQQKMRKQGMNQQKIKKQGMDQPRIAGQGMNKQGINQQEVSKKGANKQEVNR